MVENMGLAVEISLLSHSVPELYLLPVYRPPLLFPVVADCRPTSANVGYSSSVLDVAENVKYPLKSRRYLKPFQSYYYFQFIGRHCYFRLSAECRPTSGNVGDSSGVLGVVENV